MSDTRKVFQGELLHDLGSSQVIRRIRLLAEDEQDARDSARYYRKNFETIGDVREGNEAASASGPVETGEMLPHLDRSESGRDSKRPAGTPQQDPDGPNDQPSGG